MDSRTQLRNRNWLIALAGGVLALGLIAVGASRIIPGLFERESPEVAEPLPARTSVVALGRVEPRSEVVRVSGPSGERIGQLEVREGKMVEAGDVLAYLESYQERLAERNLAEAELAEAEQRLAAQTSFGHSQIDEASARIEQVDRPMSFEIEAQEATVRQLEAELELANEDLQRFQELFEDGAIATQQLDEQRTRARRALEELNSARSNLIRLEQQRERDMEFAQTQLQSAEANLSLTQVQVAVESARQNLELAAARLDRTIIRAPFAGRVLRIMARSGEAITNQGILDLGDTSQMFVVAEVYETDVNLVQPGQPATISSRGGAFDGTLTGEVAEVGWQIFKNDVLDDDPAADADARVVEVKIRLDNGEVVQGLTNLQVDVRIDVGEA